MLDIQTKIKDKMETRRTSWGFIMLVTLAFSVISFLGLIWNKEPPTFDVLDTTSQVLAKNQIDNINLIFTDSINLQSLSNGTLSIALSGKFENEYFFMPRISETLYLSLIHI